MAVTMEEVADSMFEMVKDCQGKKKLKAMDLTKAMQQRYGDECDKKMCKTAIRTLIQSKTTREYSHFDTPVGKLWTVVTVGVNPGLVM